MNRVLAFAITLVFSISALGIPLFPPRVAGIYTNTIVPGVPDLDADGVPTTPPTVSVSLLLDDGTQLVCAAASPGVPVIVTYAVPDNAGRQRAHAHAYPAGACAGDISDPSVDPAFYFFIPPKKPDLTP